MDQILLRHCNEEKISKKIIETDNKLENLRLWIDVVHAVDDKMKSYCEDAIKEFKAWTNALQNAQRNSQRDNNLADFSRHTNTYPHASSSAAASTKCINPPNLTNAE